MAEAIGAASGILALVIAALQASKAVYNTVDSFKSHRQKVREIQTELGSLTVVLESVCQQIQLSPDKQRFEPLREPLKCCTMTCEDIQLMLDKCTKHAKNKGDSISDWLQMQYREKSFDETKQRLAAYKATLSITFDAINLFVLIPPSRNY